MSDVLMRSHPDMFVYPPIIDIGGGWLVIAEQVLTDLQVLHPGLQVAAMRRDITGMLSIEVACGPGDYDVDLLRNIQLVTVAARLLSAWTCYDDGKPGWLVDAVDGRRPLCRECQERRGMKVVCHAA